MLRGEKLLNSGCRYEHTFLMELCSRKMIHLVDACAFTLPKWDRPFSLVPPLVTMHLGTQMIVLTIWIDTRQSCTTTIHHWLQGAIQSAWRCWEICLGMTQVLWHAWVVCWLVMADMTFSKRLPTEWRGFWRKTLGSWNVWLRDPREWSKHCCNYLFVSTPLSLLCSGMFTAPK